MSWLRKQFNPKMHALFTPSNIEKYRGNVPIVLRSKYEGKFANWCDNNRDIIWWSSENIAIPYRHPIKKKIVNYWPDFIICIKDKTYIIELKPESQTKPPKHSNRKSLLNEQAIYLVNKAKWQAAINYCEKFGYSFMVVKNESLMK